MARKLKTYITNLGFFELALAAPSMKAALEAWGMGHNAFHQGFAKETDDPKIVAAAMAQPGVVLKRPVGTKGAFSEKAVLPKDWSVSSDAELPRHKPPQKAKAQEKAQPKAAKAKGAKNAKDEKESRAAIISFEKEKARREKERERQAAQDEARQEKAQVRRARESEKAQAALERAQARHEEAMAAIEKERDKLDAKARTEQDRWDEEREELKAALREAGEG